MKIEEAVNTIKNALDAAIKLGVCNNLEAAQILSTAWLVLIKNLQDANNNRTEKNS